MKRHMFTVARSAAPKQFALAIALCMGCGANEHSGASLDGDNASGCKSQGGAGTSPMDSGAIPADELYAACQSNNTPEGSCAPGLVCTQIGPTDGPHCFEQATASGGCLHSTDETFMGLVCAPSCGDSGKCPSGLQCYPEGAATGWCVPP
jgi:hypothetical protein